jgi:hypothetical protein
MLWLLNTTVVLYIALTLYIICLYGAFQHGWAMERVSPLSDPCFLCKARWTEPQYHPMELPALAGPPSVTLLAHFVPPWDPDVVHGVRFLPTPSATHVSPPLQP